MNRTHREAEKVEKSAQKRTDSFFDGAFRAELHKNHPPPPFLPPRLIFRLFSNIPTIKYYFVAKNEDKKLDR